MNGSPPRYRAVTETVSLVLGPALMSLGDLLHPAETWDVPAQVAIAADSASRWHVAHLLLFIGLLVFVPCTPAGLLAFFIGTGLAVVTLASSDGSFRWPAIMLGLGALLILGEIAPAQIILSQIGNILLLVAGIGLPEASAEGKPRRRDANA